MHLSVAWLVGWLIDGLVCWVVGRFLACRLAGNLNCWLMGFWLIYNRLVG